MALILTVAAIGAMLWVLVAVLRGWIPYQIAFCPTLVAGCVIVLGSVFGREFFSWRVGPVALTIDRILWVWMMCLCGAYAWTHRQRLPRWNATDILVGLLLVVLTVSTFAHDFMTRDHLPLTRLLFFNLMPIGIYGAVRVAPANERQLQWIIRGLFVFGLYLAVTAILEWRNIPQLVFPAYIMDSSHTEFLGRARGPFLNPVVDGIFQLIGFIAALSLWTQAKTTGRAILLIAYAVFMLGVFATFTRSVWVSFVLAVGLVVWLSVHWRQRGGMLVGGAVAAGLFLALFSDDFAVFKRDRYVSESEMAESLQLRPLLAEVAWSMFRDKPIWGHGFGQYTDAKRLYHQAATDSPLKKVMPYMQHNVMLSYLTETGLVGMLLLLGIFLLFARQAWIQFANSPPHSALQTISLLGMAMLLAYIMNGMFHDVSIMPMVGSLYFFLLGLNHRDLPLVARSLPTLERPAEFPVRRSA